MLELEANCEVEDMIHIFHWTTIVTETIPKN